MQYYLNDVMFNFDLSFWHSQLACHILLELLGDVSLALFELSIGAFFIDELNTEFGFVFSYLKKSHADCLIKLVVSAIVVKVCEVELDLVLVRAYGEGFNIRLVLFFNDMLEKSFDIIWLIHCEIVCTHSIDVLVDSKLLARGLFFRFFITIFCVMLY